MIVCRNVGHNEKVIKIDSGVQHNPPPYTARGVRRRALKNNQEVPEWAKPLDGRTPKKTAHAN